MNTYPTPCAHDAMCTQSTKPHGWIVNGREAQRRLNDMAIRMTYPPREMNKQFDTPTVHGDGGSGRKGNVPKFGQLNPDWVEWLMGWPVGWTDADLEDPRDWLPLPDDPADLPPSDPGYIPRVTTRRENRASRIKALGNGQVPLCAAVALETMLETLALLSRHLDPTP